jgi:hypothetical protein
MVKVYSAIYESYKKAINYANFHINKTASQGDKSLTGGGVSRLRDTGGKLFFPQMPMVVSIRIIIRRQLLMNLSVGNYDRIVHANKPTAWDFQPHHA